MANPETEIGGVLQDFPSTSWTLLGEARAAEDSPLRRATLDRLVGLYWKPIYWLIRSQWSKTNEDAKDLTQEFFSRTLIDGPFLEAYDPQRASFRTFLKGALTHFLCNENRSRATIKRGGGARIVRLETDDAALDVPAFDTAGLSPELAFDAAWRRFLVGQGLARLRDQLRKDGREAVYEVFRRHDLEPPPEGASYAEIATALGLTRDVVKHHLSRARQEFRDALVRVLCGYVRTADGLAAEMQDLFGL